MSDVLILSYHAVSEDWPAAISVTPDRFERQLSLLLDRGYRSITFHEAVTSPPRGRTVAVTFDDAYRSVLELAFPVLSRLGMHATVFVPTDLIGTGAPMSWPGIDHWLGSPHEAELVAMGWNDLTLLVSRGWEVGSHARSHPWLTTIDDAALEAELQGSRERCEAETGGPCRSLAYPFGDHDHRVLEAARAAGYAAACVGPMRVRDRNPLRVPRVGVYHEDTNRMFRVKISPRVRRLRGTPIWMPLDRIRHVLQRVQTGRQR